MERPQALIDDSPMQAEIGLDYHFVSDPKHHAFQRDVFEYFVRQGVCQKKILNIDSNRAESDTGRIPANLGAAQAIIHWYFGPVNQLYSLVEKGVYFSIGVGVLFDANIREMAKAIPRALLLTETDNPSGYHFLSGRMRVPSIIGYVVQTISELRGWSTAETADIVQRNFVQLAQDDGWAKRIPCVVVKNIG